MKQLLYLCIILYLLIALPAQAEAPYVRLLVKFDKAITFAQGKSAIQDFAQKQGLHIKTFEPLLENPAPEFAAVGLNRVAVVELTATDAQTVARQLVKSLPRVVEYAEPDTLGSGGGVPNDPLFDNQWGLENANDHEIDILGAWDITQGSADVLIAVLDSGISLQHEEFVGKVVAGSDFVNGDDDPTDDLGHGSNVAGIAAANTNNSKGIAGVCPNCQILAIKVLDENNRGYYSWWIEGLNEAVQYKADVINMSLGGTYDSPLLANAITAATNSGAIIVACMMNTNSEAIYYPAAYPETIAVGATDRNDNRANPFSWGGGSNFGEHIDIVAPGNQILGPSYIEGAYEFWSGTSQATPHVSGTIGLMLTVNPNLTLDDVRQILHATAEDLVGDPAEDTPGFDIYYGYGRLNAAKALQMLIETELENSENLEQEITTEFEPEQAISEAEEINGYERLDGDLDQEQIEKKSEELDSTGSTEKENEYSKVLWHFHGERGCATQNSVVIAAALLLLAIQFRRGKI